MYTYITCLCPKGHLISKTTPGFQHKISICEKQHVNNIINKPLKLTQQNTRFPSGRAHGNPGQLVTDYERAPGNSRPDF